MKMKAIKTVLVFVAFIQCSATKQALGQVTLSPEVGVSYLPYIYGVIEGERSSESVNVLIGISGTIPVKEQWYIYTRISYTPRKNFSWYEYSGIATRLWEFTYEHNDINIDFSVTKTLFDKYYLGLGPSVVRKINTTLTTSHYVYYTPEPFVSSSNYDAFYYGVSATAGMDIKWGVLKLEYFQRFKSCCGYPPFFTNKRINLVYSYPIQVGKRR
jgi:hypothetical protein